MNSKAAVEMWQLGLKRTPVPNSRSRRRRPRCQRPRRWSVSEPEAPVEEVPKPCRTAKGQANTAKAAWNTHFTKKRQVAGVKRSGRDLQRSGSGLQRSGSSLEPSKSSLQRSGSGLQRATGFDLPSDPEAPEEEEIYAVSEAGTSSWSPRSSSRARRALTATSTSLSSSPRILRSDGEDRADRTRATSDAVRLRTRCDLIEDVGGRGHGKPKSEEKEEHEGGRYIQNDLGQENSQLPSERQDLHLPCLAAVRVMDDESEEEEDGIPWCWKYVALVVINPFIGGMCLSYVWGPLALHWKANNWPAWHLGALSMLVVQLRTPAVQLLVSSGLWMTLVFVLVSFLVMLPSIFLPNEEWAAAVLVIVEAFELFVLYDAVSFVSFAETEMMAQQATAHTLQYFTLSSALAPTVGGATYILFGWQGIACLGAGLKFLQLVVLVTDSTVQGQVVHICLFLSGRFKDDLDDLIDDDGLPPTAPGQPATTERLSDASVNSGDPPFVGHNSSRSPKRELDESRMTPVLPGMPEPEEEDDFVRNFILLRLFCLFFRLFLWLKQAGVLTKACSLACGRLWMAGFSCSLAFGYVSPFCRRRTPRTRIYGLPAHLGWLKGAEGGEF
eukprot:g23720.t1